MIVLNKRNFIAIMSYTRTLKQIRGLIRFIGRAGWFVKENDEDMVHYWYGPVLVTVMRK